MKKEFSISVLTCFYFGRNSLFRRASLRVKAGLAVYKLNTNLMSQCHI